MAIHQLSAGFDLNVDLMGTPGANIGDYFCLDDSLSVGVNYNAPVNGPISLPAPWTMQYNFVPTGNIGGSYSAGSVWKGVQIFTTPDAVWTRKADRAFSNGAMTFTPWLKVMDLNCPDETY